MAPAFVESFIRYSDRTAEGGFIRANGDYSFGMEDHPRRIHNARMEDIDFDVHGFKLLKHATDVDFTNPADVEQRYYPDVRRMVQELTGAREVFPFMGIRRGGEEAAGGGPALSAHVDFNEPSLRSWIRRLAPDRGDEFADKRLVNINLWRGLAPVGNMPLAVCDSRSVDKGDFMLVRFGEGQTASLGGTPGGLNMAFNPSHRWLYYPDMQPDEVLLFRLYDTADPRWHMTGHTAFVDPTSQPDSPKRVSYELRTIAVFD